MLVLSVSLFRGSSTYSVWYFMTILTGLCPKKTAMSLCNKSYRQFMFYCPQTTTTLLECRRCGFSILSGRMKKYIKKKRINER